MPSKHWKRRAQQKAYYEKRRERELAASPATVDRLENVPLVCHKMVMPSTTVVVAHGSRDNGSESFLQEFPDERRINIGESYQAVLPPCDPLGWSKRERLGDESESEICLWMPPPADICPSDSSLSEYCVYAQEKYRYTLEQALGLLQFCQFDVKKAMSDLDSYKPITEEWSQSDKLLFEQAFVLNGKSFHRIKQMIPDKSIADLVNFYYQWKKKRQNQVSVLDRVRKKVASTEMDYSDDSSDSGDENHDQTAKATERKRKSGSQEGPDFVSQSAKRKRRINECRNACLNCCLPIPLSMGPPGGGMCGFCFLSQRRMGRCNLSPNIQKDNQNGDDLACSNEQSVDQAPTTADETFKNCQNENVDKFMETINLNAAARAAGLRKLEEEITQLRLRVQRSKSFYSDLGPFSLMRTGFEKGAYDVSHLRPQHCPKGRINVAWSTFESLLAVQGFRRYGRDFETIADIVGNKTACHVKSFYQDYNEKYNLDALVAEYEDEKQHMDKSASEEVNFQ